MKNISYRPSEEAKAIIEEIRELKGYNRNATINLLIEIVGRPILRLLLEAEKHEAALREIREVFVLQAQIYPKIAAYLKRKPIRTKKY